MKKILIIGIIVAAVLGVTFAVLKGVTGFNVSKEKTVSNVNKNEGINPKTEPNKGSSTVTACNLITLDDAKTLLGTNTVKIDNAGTNAATTADVAVDNCSYTADGATIGDTKQLTIQTHHGDKAQVKQAYDNYKNQYPGTAIEDLGDQAYYSTEGKNVQVIKDNTWLFIGGGSVNDGGNKELEIQAAKIALKKL